MHALWYMPLVTLYLSDIRLIVTHACETGAYADEYFVSVWTVAAKTVIIPRNHIAIWMELGSEWHVCQVDSFRSTVKRPTTETKACVYLQNLCSSFLCLVT